jgi:hypothetical protein
MWGWQSFKSSSLVGPLLPEHKDMGLLLLKALLPPSIRKDTFQLSSLLICRGRCPFLSFNNHSITDFKRILELLDYRISFGPSRQQDADGDPCINHTCVDN